MQNQIELKYELTAFNQLVVALALSQFDLFVSLTCLCLNALMTSFTMSSGASKFPKSEWTTIVTRCVWVAQDFCVLSRSNRGHVLATWLFQLCPMFQLPYDLCYLGIWIIKFSCDWLVEEQSDYSFWRFEELYLPFRWTSSLYFSLLSTSTLKLLLLRQSRQFGGIL